MPLRTLPTLACLVPMLAVPAHAAEGLRLDGIPDEAIWAQAQVFDEFRVNVPYTLAAPTHLTQARLLSLPEGLAVAIVAMQPPGTPRVKPRAVRDADSSADRVNFAVDFDADGRLAYNFMVTLGGAIADEVISNENAYNSDWDGLWQYGLHEGEDRWSVEMLIPWSVAAMRRVDGATRPLAVHFDRVLASRNERSASTSASYQRPRFVSEFARVEVPNHTPRGLLSIVPYASAQYDLIGDGADGRAGVDLFWKPSSRFQLSATLNPDFGQVEADDLVVNFDAIEVFFSDKRPFFTENQGIFNVTTPDSGQLVYTRRIGGGRDDGDGAAEVDAAVKVNGSAAGFDYGVLAAIESDHADDLGRAFYVQRLVRGIGPWTLGYLGTWTDRPFLDRRAQVHAVDAIWRPNAQWLVSGQVLGSFIDQGGLESDGRGAWIRAFYTPNNRFQQELEITHFDRRLDFNDAGYQRRANYNELEWTTTLRKSDFADDDWRRSQRWGVEPQLRYNDRGQRLPSYLLLTTETALRNGGIWYGELITASSGIDDLISRGNGDVVQDPRLTSLYSSYETPRIGRWIGRAGLYLLQEGNDDYAVEPQFEAHWFPRDDLDLSLLFYPRWSRDWLIWREDTLFASYRRKRMRLEFDLNWFPGARHEVRLKAQWLGIDADDATPYRIGGGGHLVASEDVVDDFTVNSFGLQLRYRYEFAPQRELYVVYARGGEAQALESVGDPGPGRAGMGDLFGDVLDLRDADQVLVKLRWGY